MSVRRAALIIGAGVSLLASSGCHSPVTEIVVVVDTDLSLPDQADTFELEVRSPGFDADQVFGPSRPLDGGVVSQSTLPTFPATIGIVPHDDGSYVPFDVTAVLLRTPAGASQPSVVVRRSATGVQFVRGETRMLFLSLLAECTCAGTTCPTSPPCGDLTSPTLTAFDPAHLPRVPGGADGGADAPSSLDGASDASAETGPEALPDVAADLAADEPRDGEPEAPSADASKDVAPEAPPLLARGHTCSAASQCQDKFCVDGFCCESKCTCGTCGGASPGSCVPAAANTDPHDACGSYTCDGAGACVTTCPQTYGDCSAPCKPGAFCDGAGSCMPAVEQGGNFCVLGTCTCPVGFACKRVDGGVAGVCQ